MIHIIHLNKYIIFINFYNIILYKKAKREETKVYTEEDINNDVNTLYQATEAKWNASEKVVT